jgi:hypothetical protein
MATSYALERLPSHTSALPLWHHATPVAPRELVRLLHQSRQGARFKKSFDGDHFSNIVLKRVRIWKTIGERRGEEFGVVGARTY